MVEYTDYTTSFVVDRTPLEVFTAVNDVRGWWSRDLDGTTDALGAEFVFRAKDIHRSRIAVTGFVPGERVVWTVVENYMNFIDDQTEWVGTEIRFEITPTAAGTELRFTHHGLVPDYECFDICSNAWGFYINSSLRELLVTGEGQPIARADELDPAT